MDFFIEVHQHFSLTEADKNPLLGDEFPTPFRVCVLVLVSHAAQILHYCSALPILKVKMQFEGRMQRGETQSIQSA